MHRFVHPGIPLVALLSGIVYLVLASIYDIHWQRELFTEFSNASIIFGALGLTLEPWMRKAIARDVFRAAFGYHMPDDFRTEIGRIASHTIICTKHLMEVTIKNVDTDYVKITLTVERHLQNIGIVPRLQRGMITVTDWGFQKSANITRCEISDMKGTRRKSFRHVEHRKEDMSIKAETPRMLLRSQETAIVIYDYESILRRNDHFI
jgi:hypothetical protein